MPEAIAAKYTGKLKADGTPAQYHGGIPARDLTEDEFSALSDEHKATLAHSKIYELRRDAPKVADAADRRVAHEMAQADVTPKAAEAKADAPKATGKA
jgi:hypothetical protein